MHGEGPTHLFALPIGRHVQAKGAPGAGAGIPISAQVTVPHLALHRRWHVTAALAADNLAGAASLQPA